MCNQCAQNNLTMEEEAMIHGEGETQIFHPDLGPGRSVPRTDEISQFETTTIYHPLLGQGKSVPKSSEVNYESEIVGLHSRVNVTNTIDVPFRWICYLNLFFPDPDDSTKYRAFMGSGTLISPRHILTAGHCSFSHIKGSRGTVANLRVAKILATPGSKTSGPGPFGSVRAINAQYTSNWQNTQNPRFDFSLITLAEDIGSKAMSALGGKPLGYWGSSANGDGTRINPKDRNTLKNLSANISGYPADKPDGTQWRAYGNIVNTMPAAGSELIYYDFDTCGGHSGAPVWLRWQNFRNLIAIHTGPCITGNGDCNMIAGVPCFPSDPTSHRYTSNRGVLITPSVLSQVRQWMNS